MELIMNMPDSLLTETGKELLNDESVRKAYFGEEQGGSYNEKIYTCGT